jgi:hypothetical protein
MHGDEFTRIPVDGESEADARIVSIVRTQVLLGDITRREVMNMIRRNQLETIKVGRRRMVLVKSIDSYIDERIEAAKSQLVAA